MKRRYITFEVGIFVLLFSLALFVRLLNLGKTPLSDYEAGWALQSWNAIYQDEGQVGSNPAYFALTTSLFYLLGSSNFLARFWPALIGSLVIWAPFGFRRFLGREVSIIMGLGLALDPGLVAVSRIAGGPMLALGFAVLFLMFIYLRKPIWAGFLGGMGLISGSFVYLGLTGFLVAYWISLKLGILPEWEDTHEESELIKSPPKNSTRIREGLISAFVPVTLVGPLFTLFPGGLGGWGRSLATFFMGWVQTPMVPVLQPSLAVVFYQPLATLFALIAIGRGWMKGKKKERWLSIWLLTAFTLTVLYSQRYVFDSIWVLLPLWALASIEFSRFIRIPELPIASFCQAGLLFVLGVIFWLVSINPGLGESTWLILLVIPLLAILTTVFIGLGWSWDSARTGAGWGIFLILGIYTFSATFGATQQRQNTPAEFWYPTPGIAQSDLFRETLGELALRESGREDWIQTVSLIESTSLKWVLRDVHGVTYASSLEPGTLPAIIISPGDGTDLSQTMSYRGQDFIWYKDPGWSGPFPKPLWSWVTARITPVDSESIVMWVRSDLFPAEQEKTDDENDLESLSSEIQMEDGNSE